MGSWKNHVRAGLHQRDRREKLPFVGVFTSLSQLEERFEVRKQILEDVQTKSLEGGGVEFGKNNRLLQLQLRESEHLAEKVLNFDLLQSSQCLSSSQFNHPLSPQLSQTVSDLTTVLYLKEAELQHWQSRSSSTSLWQIRFQFAHSALPEDEPRNRETCTSTGAMLSQVKSSLPQALNSQRCRSREYPASGHDNKEALRDDISVFSHGVGRRKCLDDRRQHNSHFCLCHDGADGGTAEAGGNLSAYQIDFMVKQAVNVPTSNRRFPRNHKQNSEEAALAQAGEQFMWFGQHDSDISQAPRVAATHSSKPSKP
ncbi:hypothetical protein INR49_013281 [Caranx melampygus]|nr:hypothetical protein INR49_013281 [Caranx melampygus]